jgi:hypothetical protein
MKPSNVIGSKVMKTLQKKPAKASEKTEKNGSNRAQLASRVRSKEKVDEVRIVACVIRDETRPGEFPWDFRFHSSLPPIAGHRAGFLRFIAPVYWAMNSPRFGLFNIDRFCFHWFFSSSLSPALNKQSEDSFRGEKRVFLSHRPLDGIIPAPLLELERVKSRKTLRLFSVA